MKRVKLGDIVEISTNKGLAYAHYTHYNREYGALIRVKSGLFPERPADLTPLANRPTKFCTFFPLQAAVNKSIVVVVGNAQIPPEAEEFPIFRSGLLNPKTGKVDTWWLWDGEKDWRVGQLTPAQRRLPILGIWNDTLLIERIESDWSPEKDQT